MARWWAWRRLCARACLQVCSLGSRVRDMLLDVPWLPQACPALWARLEEARERAGEALGRPLTLHLKGEAGPPSSRACVLSRGREEVTDGSWAAWGKVALGSQ